MARRFLGYLTLAGLFISLSFMSAGADTYPSQPIRIVVTGTPGSSPDVLARIVGQYLSPRIGQPIVVDNKPGGGSNIAHEAVARAAPDGYTLLLAGDPLPINQTLFRELSYHALDSFTPVVNLMSAPQVIAVHSDVPARTMAEFITLARKDPGKVSLASPSVGTPGHLSVLLLEKLAGIKLTPVVYKSAQPAVTDTLAKNVNGVVATLSNALPFIKEGRLRALAVSSGQRSPSLPDVPTMVESGYPGFNFTNWQGIVAPAGTPKPVIERLNREINAVLDEPAVLKAFAAQAFDKAGGAPESLGKTIKDAVAMWGDIIRANNIRSE